MLELAEYRTVVGRSSELWRGSGRHDVDERRWLTLSGLPSVDYNVICCHGSGMMEASLADVAGAQVPAVILAGGQALADVQVLADAGWVCIGSTPVMRLDLTPFEQRDPDPGVRRLGEADLAAARSIVVDAFGIEGSWGSIALPDRVAEDEALAAWGLTTENGHLWSVLVAVSVGSTVVVWSMATRPVDHGRGYGRRLLEAVAHDSVMAKAEEMTLYASAAGRHLYDRTGFEVVEHLQQWSRPRWVLGRG